jgi:kynurenine formamidase
MPHCLKTLLAAVLVSTPLSAACAQDNNWFPSKWGAEDTLGAANYLTPELAVQAAGLVKQGKAHPLGIVTGRDTPAFPPRSYDILVLQPGQIGEATLGPTGTVYNDDVLHTWVGIGSQLDGLGHIGIDHVYYNGTKAMDFTTPAGLTKFGLENFPPVVTRGVVLDIAGLKGVEMMEEGQPISAEDIQAAEEKQGVQIREGDVVLLHTGWLDIIQSEPERFAKAEPGLSKSGAEYLVSKNVVAVGADNWAVEVLPGEEGTGTFEIHQILLPKNGTYLLENMNTRPLVEDGVSEFMFVLGAPRFAGSVQAVINPVAIY